MDSLSKSRLIAFRQCPKRLWLEVHRPELRDDSAATLTSFQVGNRVGDIARRIYDPQGSAALIDIKIEGVAGAIERSKGLLADGRQTVFEAGLSAANVVAFADVMVPALGGNEPTWKMIEVKSSTSVKNYHRDDVAIQTFVAREAGVHVQSVALACIDSSWTYLGDDDFRGLLIETDLTDETISRRDEVKGWIAAAQDVVGQETEPVIAVGPQCSTPFECGFCRYCNSSVAQPEHPVDWLPRLTPAQRSTLAEMEVGDMGLAPDDLLNDAQRLVKACTLNGTVFFDADGARADLALHGFPCTFLDFETIQFAVPVWKGTRPYQQIPFQFSLHQISEDGQLSHADFLDLTGADPSVGLIHALMIACGVSGPIFAYNASFEKSRISELADRFPESATALMEIHDRIVDLLPIARARYYHPSQKGSWSIKSVIAAAIPDLSYEKLDGVKDGSMAMLAYAKAIRADTAVDRRIEIRHQLLAYCEMDTLAMVRLWQFFSGCGERG